MIDRGLFYNMTDAERRISNIVMIGQVKELDEKKARVRVQAGPILTDWIPFAAHRAGLDRTWHVPEPGEQVVMVAPGGDLTQAVVIGSIYRDQYPAPADDADITRTVWYDGAILDYNRERHHWRLLLPDSGRITMQVGISILEIISGRITMQVGNSILEITDSGIILRASRIDLN